MGESDEGLENKADSTKVEEKLSVKQQLALEERKILQSIINQQEDVSFKIRGWAIALFSGMTYIHIKEPSEFSGGLYFFATFVLLFIFAALETRHMEAFFKLVERCGEVEPPLSFAIQSSLNKKSNAYTIKGFIQLLMRREIARKDRHVEILFVYFALMVVSISIALFS